MIIRTTVYFATLLAIYCFCFSSPRPSLMDWSIAAILCLMSVYLLVAIERAIRYAIGWFDSDRLEREVAEALKMHGIEEALNVCGHHNNNLLAIVIRTALAEIRTAPSIAHRDLEQARTAFRRVCGVEIASLKRGMALLKTIGQTAVLLGFMTAAFDMCTVLDFVCGTEGAYPAVFAYEGAAALRFAVAGMLISLVAICTYRFICFRIERVATQADRAFPELAGLYVQHRTAMEGIERIQRSGLQIWEP